MLTFRCFAGSLTTHTHTHTHKYTHPPSPPKLTPTSVMQTVWLSRLRFVSGERYCTRPFPSRYILIALNSQRTRVILSFSFPSPPFSFFLFFFFFFFDFSRLGHANYLHPARSLSRRTSTMNTRCGIRIRLVCAVPALSSIFKNHLVIRMHRRSTWKPRSQREYSGRENRAPRR